MCNLVIISSVILVFSVRNFRKSAFVTLHGRFPIHIPGACRWDGAEDCVFSFSSVAAAVAFTATELSFEASPECLMVGVSFAFLARRTAFFEGGSGAAMLTSISSNVLSCRLRFREGDGELEWSDDLAILSYDDAA